MAGHIALRRRSTGPPSAAATPCSRRAPPPPSGATASGGFTITDGAFAETKEALGGYYLVEAADLDEAIAMAKEIPCPAGGVEVRPDPTAAETRTAGGRLGRGRSRRRAPS